MVFDVLIPARLAATRLPRKPLLDIAGTPMVVRVAQQAARSGARSVVVAADDAEIVEACSAYGVRALLTSPSHPSGSDRLAEACALLGLDGDAIVVNVQGDEPLIEPAVIQACASALATSADCAMSTVAHPITDHRDFANPNVVKVVLDARRRALYFSRAPIPYRREPPATAEEPTSSRDSRTGALALPSPAPLRHVGVYAYRVAFLRRYATLSVSPLEQIESLEQLRVLWHGEHIAVHVADSAPGRGVDTAEDLAAVREIFRHAKAAGLA